MIEPGTTIHFNGGRFNGLNGVVAKVCEQFCSVRITIAGDSREVVEELKFLTCATPATVAP